MRVDCVIAIDPGKLGGIAVYQDRVSIYRMPEDLTELSDFFAYYAENFSPVVFLEKLSVRPDDVVAAGSKVNMGKLYRIQKMIGGYEQLKAIIGVSGIPYVLVHPASWQAKLGLRIKGEKKEERKRRYKMIAGEMYPGVKVAMWNADALLLLRFGRWALEERMSWVKANLPAKEFGKLFG